MNFINNLLLILCTTACIIFNFSEVKGQDTDIKTGNWIMYFGSNRISDNFSVHSEVQWRNHTIGPNIEQLLIRGGLNYHINNNFILTAGYGYVSTHPEDKEVVRKLSDEHRIYQQLIIKNALSKLFFEHRYRYEQRWVNSNFRQRARYRLMVSFPLNNEVIEEGAWFLAVYDEIFLNLHKGEFFDRNRLYGALGYQFSSVANVQVGYLRQTVPTFGKNYLQFALFFNPDLRR